MGSPPVHAALFTLDAEGGDDCAGVVGAPEFVGGVRGVFHDAGIFPEAIERGAVGADEPEAIAELERFRAEPPGACCQVVGC